MKDGTMYIAHVGERPDNRAILKEVLRRSPWGSSRQLAWDFATELGIEGEARQRLELLLADWVADLRVELFNECRDEFKSAENERVLATQAS